MRDSGAESWTVGGDDHVSVEPVERWLAYLPVIERSPKHRQGVCHDLKDSFVFLQVSLAAAKRQAGPARPPCPQRHHRQPWRASLTGNR
jgi:hypothetical protein